MPTDFSVTLYTMAKRTGAMHVAKVSKKYVTKDGTSRESVAYLLRRTYRDGDRVKHETLANLSALPEATLEAVRVSLTGQALVVPGEDLEVTRSLPYGHVAAVYAQAKALAMPALLGPASRDRDLALALVIARVCRPGSKLATTRWWADTTLGADLGVADATTDEVYAAMDWLAGRQDAIEKRLAARHLDTADNPNRLALFDLASSWVTGKHCPLAARGYSRDGKKALPQIEYGLLTDPVGRPVAVRVVAGNTADPSAFTGIVQAVRDTFGLKEMVMVGDRGMITSARIEALRELGGFGWVTALRAPAIAALANAWSRAATPPWPNTVPTNAWRCWPAPTPSWPRSLPQSRPDAWPAQARSGSASAKSSAGTRWPSTTPWTSPTTPSATPATRMRSPPRRPWTVSTSSVPRSGPSR
jgi:hypothetical protein